MSVKNSQCRAAYQQVPPAVDAVCYPWRADRFKRFMIDHQGRMGYIVTGDERSSIPVVYEARLLNLGRVAF